MGCHTGRARSSCAQCALDLCQQAKERELEELKAKAHECALEIESTCGKLGRRRCLEGKSASTGNGRGIGIHRVEVAQITTPRGQTQIKQ